MQFVLFIIFFNQNITYNGFKETYISEMVVVSLILIIGLEFESWEYSCVI